MDIFTPTYIYPYRPACTYVHPRAEELIVSHTDHILYNINTMFSANPFYSLLQLASRKGNRRANLEDTNMLK